MPESFVNVTEGSGKKLHTFQRTIGANNVEDEYTLNGEPALATYTVGASLGASTAVANSHLLQIMAGASLKIRIRRIEMYQYAMATTAAMMQLALMRLSSAGTGGTTATPTPLDTAEAAAGATAMSVPGAKGTETAKVYGASVYLMQTVAASAPLSSPSLVWDFDRPRSKPLIIPAGAANGIALKNEAAYAGAGVFFVVTFDEASF